MPGILWGSDYDRLTASAVRVLEKFAYYSIVRFAEIGVHDGRTSRSLVGEIRQWYQMAMIKPYFHYYGVDPLVEDPGIDECFTLVKTPSHLAMGEISNRLDWVFIDGCHCAICVERDLHLYGNQLANGGELCFHDASVLAQGHDPQDYGGMAEYHDVIAARRGIAVREVLDRAMTRHPMFTLVEAAPLDQQYGGVEVYKKV